MSLALVAEKPQRPPSAGGCAAVLLHLLDWHRRLLKKRRLLPARRPHKNPPPPTDVAAAGGITRTPGLVARLMGLESLPAAEPLQKQRKVEAKGEAAAAQRPRRHHGLDLPARSPRLGPGHGAAGRGARFVHAAAARMLEPSARARLALGYVAASPSRHAREVSDESRRPGMEVPRREMDVCSSEFRNGYLIRGTEAESVAVHPDLGKKDTSRNSRNARKVDTDIGILELRQDVVRVARGKAPPRSEILCGNVVAKPKDPPRVLIEPPDDCDCTRVTPRNMVRKRGALARPAIGNAGAVESIRLTRVKGNASRKVMSNGSCPRREPISSVHAKGSSRGKAADRSETAFESKRMTNTGSCPRRESRKRADGDAVSRREVTKSNAVAFGSGSSVKPITRPSPSSKMSEKIRDDSGRSSGAPQTREPPLVAKCAAISSNGDAFGKLLEAKIRELGLADRTGFATTDALSGRLTASVLQELISALTGDAPASQESSQGHSGELTPTNGVANGCDGQTPEFHKYYQGDSNVGSSAIHGNNKNNQTSPTSVLEASFSNDSSSLGSPSDDNGGKPFFGLLEDNKADFIGLDSDLLDSATSVDAIKPGTEEIRPASDTTLSLPCAASCDFGFLEARLHSVKGAISNAELLLGSNFSCDPNGASSFSFQSFVIRMLETTVEVFSGSGEKGSYQLTNFFFDCITECLDSKFRDFGKCGYSTWLRLPLFLSKDLLGREICEEIRSWMEMERNVPDALAEKELSHVTAKWATCEIETFEISIEIENDIIQALVDEFAFD